MNQSLLKDLFYWLNACKQAKQDESKEKVFDFIRYHYDGQLCMINWVLTSVCECCFCTEEQLEMSRKRFMGIREET